MLLKGKKALIMGVANNRSIAYGISSAFAREGARLAFSYAGDAIKKRVEPICEELGGEFTFPCDVSSDAEIAAAAEKVKEKWGKIDVLVHSVAYAPKEELGPLSRHLPRRLQGCPRHLRLFAGGSVPRL